ncbi:WD40 repeat-like protein [Coniophora puteana RWD-64-598 SS2]|uniref:WD40 repeat-like protein n=1 Tax=Coniophora puteana (strain RWD-64-598) TaxID=741705 RepID=A0A5M3N784_CONPW|nr:WD40 repeat-like protein [Coniophora puteana RWD-64-598 SS2]EIW87027.1 WD40 repeat-like protein [Coniophora puteana RWD-64-598 SS2]
MAALKALNRAPLLVKQPKDIPLPLSPADSDDYAQPRNARKNKKPQAKPKTKVKGKDGPPPPTPHPINPTSRSQEILVDGGQPWTWRSLTDSSTNANRPLFTRDGSHFFSISGNNVKIHSSASGKVASTLPGTHHGGHTDVVTCAIINTQNPFQLITGSLDGTLKIWDYLEGKLLYSLTLDQPIYNLCAHSTIKGHVFVSAAKPKKARNDVPKKPGEGSQNQDESCVVLRVSLKPKDSSSGVKNFKSSQVVPVGKTKPTSGIEISASGQWLVAVAGHKAYVAKTSALKSGFTKYVSPDPLTCLAVHPSQDYFATGDARGVIRLWYCLNEDMPKVTGVEKRAQTSTFHWHAHAVSSIAFTSNGAYLLSGGEESVLVIWQLHTQKKEFVPRVGSPIKSIVVSRNTSSEEEYLLGLADASYAFVNSTTLKLARVFSRIKIDPDVPSRWDIPTPLAVHVNSSTLILPSSHPSSLQTYSIDSSMVTSELEVSPSNRVSRRDEKALQPSRVERIALSFCGHWMATLDRRLDDEDIHGESYLKFWRWDKRIAFWILNTRVNKPHGQHRITSMSFNPVGMDNVDLLQLVTTGEDGCVKSWRLRIDREIQNASWTGRSQFGFRSEIPRHISWSPDGSLLAIALDPYVAVYNPVTNSLRYTIICSNCKHVTSAHFVGASGRYLVVQGGSDLILWDMVTQSMRWHYRNDGTIYKVVSHPHHDLFAIFHTSRLGVRFTTDLKLFGVKSSRPTISHTFPFGLRSVAWHTNPRKSRQPSFSLVGITQSYSVVLLGNNLTNAEDEDDVSKALPRNLTEQKRTLFEEMFGISAFVDVKSPSNVSQSNVNTALPWKQQDTSRILDTPAFLMPPMETLYDSLISGFLRLRTNDQDQQLDGVSETAAEDGMDIDQDVEDVTNNTLGLDEAEKELQLFGDFFEKMTGSSGYPLLAKNAMPSERSTPPASRSLRSQNRATPMSQVIPPDTFQSPDVPTQVGKKRSRNKA